MCAQVRPVDTEHALPLCCYHLTLMVANFANTKWCKRPCKMTKTLAHVYSSESSQQEVYGLDDFQKSLCHCALDERSISIGRVNVGQNIWSSKFFFPSLTFFRRLRHAWADISFWGLMGPSVVKHPARGPRPSLDQFSELTGNWSRRCLLAGTPAQMWHVQTHSRLKKC